MSDFEYNESTDSEYNELQFNDGELSVSLSDHPSGACLRMDMSDGATRMLYEAMQEYYGYWSRE